MERSAGVTRTTTETEIQVQINLSGNGKANVTTGIPFFDHMLTLMAMHGFFDLVINAKGDLEVDLHHTVEDVGIVLGDAVNQALGDRKGIRRYGHAVTPMDEALATVSLDFCNRPFLVYNVPGTAGNDRVFDISLAKEFLRALAVHAGMTLHINLAYGDNPHHILESIFKALGRAMQEAVSLHDRLSDVRSTKGLL